MITGELKSKIDAIWNAFWSGGISNPMEVMEQLTYLLFLRRLDELPTLEENKSNRLKQPMERRIFPEGLDARGCNYNDYRWSHFKNLAPADMFEVIADHVFPFLKTIGSDDSTYSHHMRDARFTIPTPALEQMLVECGGGAGEISRAREQAKGLGLFVRSLVGLDRDAASDALSGFLAGKSFNASQIEVSNLVIQHLTEHGVMSAALLYESPFTDITPSDPDKLFDSAQMDELLLALRKIEASALVA